MAPPLPAAELSKKFMLVLPLRIAEAFSAKIAPPFSATLPVKLTEMFLLNVIVDCNIDSAPPYSHVLFAMSLKQCH